MYFSFFTIKTLRAYPRVKSDSTFDGLYFFDTRHSRFSNPTSSLPFVDDFFLFILLTTRGQYERKIHENRKVSPSSVDLNT